HPVVETAPQLLQHGRNIYIGQSGARLFDQRAHARPVEWAGFAGCIGDRQTGSESRVGFGGAVIRRLVVWPVSNGRRRFRCGGGYGGRALSHVTLSSRVVDGAREQLDVRRIGARIAAVVRRPRQPSREARDSAHGCARADGRSSDSRAPAPCADLPAIASRTPVVSSASDGCRSRSPLRGSPGFAPGSLLPHEGYCRLRGPPAEAILHLVIHTSASPKMGVS